jgi:hypothetical protein
MRRPAAITAVRGFLVMFHLEEGEPRAEVLSGILIFRVPDHGV